jgi:hypothetical protein
MASIDSRELTSIGESKSYGGIIRGTPRRNKHPTIRQREMEKEQYGRRITKKKEAQ